MDCSLWRQGEFHLTDWRKESRGIQTKANDIWSISIFPSLSFAIVLRFFFLQETAEKLEGKIEGTDDAVEAVAANGEAAPATASKESKNEEAAGAAAGGAAAGGAAGGAAAAAAEADASEAQDEFHEAPVASQADASKAVDGAEQAREKDLAIETNGHAESAPSAPEKREDAPPAEDKKKMSMTRRFSRSIKSKIMAWMNRFPYPSWSLFTFHFQKIIIISQLESKLLPLGASIFVSRFPVPLYLIPTLLPDLWFR